ncbi:cytochrome P450 family protein [Coniochaeta sp. 2T2.1]|nr:cytochrome P450 family protein [Coniochaeta sp. 2T2.1]
MAFLSSVLFAACVSALALYVFFSRLVVWQRLRHIPGPPEAGWSKLWLVRHQIGGRLCLDLPAVCEKYGPLARIGPKWVVCGDPAEIRRIWNVHSGYQRAPWYQGYRFDPNSDSILTATDNKEHHHIKVHLLPGYMGRGQGGQEQVVDREILNFIKLIERKYLSDRTGTRPMEMGRTLQYLTQDVTSAVEFGKAFGYIQDNDDSFGVIDALESMQLPCALMALLPPLLAMVKLPMIQLLLPKPGDKTGVGRMLGLVRDHVAERYGEKPVKNADALQSFVESGLTRDQVEAEALVHLLGGSDTTATALRCSIFYVATNPQVYRRMQAEIDAALPTATRPVVADAEAKNLPYIQAVIKETLRMWPPITGLMPKISAKNDVICGKEIPAGTFVAWSAMTVMKSTAVFGADADVFEPARWLETDEKQLREMEATQGLVFMGGTRWECLGRKLAYVEMGKVLFELFARFDFSMTNPVKPFDWTNFGFTNHKHMNVKITRRVTSESK